MYDFFGRPTTLRYHRRTPNFETYWEPDSDAVNSLDNYEMALWFGSRGDEVLSTGTRNETEGQLIVRVRKRQRT